MNSPVDLAQALLRKAADDAYVAKRLSDDLKAPDWILGFHAQQAVEKALKAVLSFHRIEFPRTHNLSLLLELLRQASLALPPDNEDIDQLIPFGVMARYEDAPDRAEVPVDREWAVSVAGRTIEWAGNVIDEHE